METRSAEDIEASTERLLQDLKAVVHDGEELLKASVQGLSERGGVTRERLSAALEIAKDTRRKLEARARAGVEVTSEMIRQHPYRALGAAFGVGLVLGVLLNRR